MEHSIAAIIEGREIVGRLDADIRLAFDRGAVAPSPTAALERLRRIYGSDRDVMLRAHAPRRAAAAVDAALPDAPLLSGHPERLLFTAPHTHWATETRIVVLCDAERDCLFIGGNAISDAGRYAPVSFVFVDGRAIPYEFLALADTMIESDLLLDFHSLVPLVAQWLDTERDGLGFSYDYRSSFFHGKTALPTVESDFNEHVGIIVPSTSFERLHGSAELAETIAVAWPALAHRRVDALEDTEAEVFARLCALLARCENEEARFGLVEHYMALLEDRVGPARSSVAPDTGRRP